MTEKKLLEIKNISMDGMDEKMKNIEETVNGKEERKYDSIDRIDCQIESHNQFGIIQS